MDQLKGSLRFIPLSAVSQFIASLGCTGRLKITQGMWSGEIALRNGEIVAAHLGSESGRAALDGLVLGLAEADFALVDEPVDEPVDESLMPSSDFASRLKTLMAERQQLRLQPGVLHFVPRLIDQPVSEANQITIHASALQVIPQLMNGQRIEQIAERRGLARTLREVAVLQAGGLVRLEAAPPPSPAQVPHPAPAARAVPPQVRPLRPVPPTHEPVARPRAAWNQSAAAAAVQADAVTSPAIHLVPPPAVVDVDETIVTSRRLPVAPVHPEAVLAARRNAELAASSAHKRTWRGALKGFFVAD